MSTLRNKLTQTLFELAFVVTRDNAALNKLQVLAFAAEFAQMYAYIYDPKIQWGIDDVQHSLGYTILHIERLGEQAFVHAYRTLALGAVVVIGTTLLSLWQMFKSGAVSTMSALYVMRFLAALFATVLFFPTLNILLTPFVAYAGYSPYFDATSEVADIRYVASSAILLPLFLPTVTLVYSFLWDPDPRCISQLGRASPSGDLVHVLLKVSMVLAFLLGGGPLGSVALFLNTLFTVRHNLHAPAFYHDVPNMWRASISTCHLVGSCFSIYIAFTDPAEVSPAMPWIALVVSLQAGWIGSALMAWRFHYLDPIAFTAARNKQREQRAADRMNGVATGADTPNNAPKARIVSSLRSIGSHDSGTNLHDQSTRTMDMEEQNFGKHQLHRTVFHPDFLNRLSSDRDVDIVIRRVLRYNEPFQLTSHWTSWFTVEAWRSNAITGRSAVPLDHEDSDDGESASGSTSRRPLMSASSHSNTKAKNKHRVGKAAMAAGIIEASLGVFPRSSLLWVRYATVLTLAFETADRATARQAVHIASTMKPALQLRYACFFISKYLQKTAFMLETGQEMDVLQVMRFQYDLRRARHHQQRAQKTAARFWRAVKMHHQDAAAPNSSSDHITISSPTMTSGADFGGMQIPDSAYAWTLSSLAEDAENHDTLANTYYNRLLEHFPNSRTVLRLFASYVANVKQEPGASKAILEYVDQLEDEESKRNTAKMAAARRAAIQIGGGRKNGGGKQKNRSNTRKPAGSSSNNAPTAGSKAKPAQKPRFQALVISDENEATSPAAEHTSVVMPNGDGGVSSGTPHLDVVTGVHHHDDDDGDDDDSEAKATGDEADDDDNRSSVSSNAARSEVSDNDDEGQETSSSRPDVAGGADAAAAGSDGSTTTPIINGHELPGQVSDAGAASPATDIVNFSRAGTTEPTDQDDSDRKNVPVSSTATISGVDAVLTMTTQPRHISIPGGASTTTSGRSKRSATVVVKHGTPRTNITTTAKPPTHTSTTTTTSSKAKGRWADDRMPHKPAIKSPHGPEVGGYQFQKQQSATNASDGADMDTSYADRVDTDGERSSVGGGSMPDRGSMHRGLGGGGRGSVRSGGRRGDGSVAGGSEMSGQQSDLFTDGAAVGNTITTVQEMIKYKNKQRNNQTVEKMTSPFARSMFWTLFLLSSCIVAIYVTGVLLLDDHARGQQFVEDAGSLRRGTQEIVYSVRRLEMGTWGTAPLATSTSVISRIQSLTNSTSGLRANASALYSSLNTLMSSNNIQKGGYKQELALWETEGQVLMQVWDDYYNVPAYVHPMSRWDGFMHYLGHANYVALMPNTTFITNANATLRPDLSKAVLQNRDVRFVLDNGPEKIFKATAQLVDGYLDHYIANTQQKQIALASIIGVVAFLPLLLTAILFRPAYILIKRDRRMATALFDAIPLHIVSSMLRRLEEGGRRGSATPADAEEMQAANRIRTVQFASVARHADDGVVHLKPTSAVSAMMIADEDAQSTSGIDGMQPSPVGSMQSPQQLLSPGAGSVAGDHEKQKLLTPPTVVVSGDGGAATPIAGRRISRPGSVTSNTNMEGDDAPDGAGAGGGEKTDIDEEEEEKQDSSAASADSSSKMNQQLRAVIWPYLLSVALLLVMSLALAGILLSTNMEFGSRGLEIKYGGERRSGSYRLMVLCNELIRGDTTTWPDLAVYNPLAPPTGLRAMLIDELTSLLTVHNAVLRGDPALGLSGYLGRDAAMDALMLAPRCAAATVDCMPIDQQMDVYANNVIQIISTPPQGLSYSMPSFVQVRTMQSNTASFQNTLNAAQDMLVQSAVPIITNARAAIDTIFGLSFILMAVAAVLLRRAVMEVQTGIARTRYVLLMLPESTIKQIHCVDVYLRDGKLKMQGEGGPKAADGQGLKNGLKGGMFTFFKRTKA